MEEHEADRLAALVFAELQFYLAAGSMGAWTVNVVRLEGEPQLVKYIEIADPMTGTVGLRAHREQDYWALRPRVDAAMFPDAR